MSAGAIGERFEEIVDSGASGSVTQKLRRISQDIADGKAAVFSGETVDRSGTITATGVPQQIMGQNPERKYLFIQNLSASGNLWVNFGSPASTTHPSFVLIPFEKFVMGDGGGFVDTQLISIVGPTTGQSYCAKEGE